MSNSYSFAAIRGVQAGRAYYVAMVPLRMVERLFRFDEEELPTALRAQRGLNKGRVPAIARYIATNAGEYVLSALSATVDGGMKFEAAVGERSIGTLVVEMTATIVINDGQHRRAGIVEALKERPHLGDETIAVTLFPDGGLARSQQMFVDLNQHGVKPSRSLRLFYDARDDAARLTRAVVEAIPLFRDLTDLTRTNLSGTSRKLFAFSNLHTATATLVDEAGLEATAEQPGPAIEFWRHVVGAMPEWRLAGEGKVSAGELRRDRVHAHGVAMEAMAIAGARMIAERPASWQDALLALGTIDWSRGNTGLWEGRALLGGRVNRSRTSVMLTADVIHRALRGCDEK
ncbi:DNA sulfur modification protein DndB [Sphingomonas ginsenosidivorax]|uniref:DNA sulfur modification protein DndB n=1 Tax=Sphingomonas ginsenosidivorax TaxID=862135 RepID=A0A5C6UET7_9SPHN|nr:DNA sulfur modification protein DndB [Sphingomonas ginsenosidivorax]TXC71327.1 DNA sulfur modification protein DndB [Sphingomonas ginsenosidivorax]